MMNSNETLDDIQWQTLIQQTAGFFSDLTIKRGFQYYKQGRVHASEPADETGVVEASVDGTETYRTKLHLRSLSDSECNCPVKDGRSIWWLFCLTMLNFRVVPFTPWLMRIPPHMLPPLRMTEASPASAQRRTDRLPEHQNGESKRIICPTCQSPHGMSCSKFARLRWERIRRIRFTPKCAGFLHHIKPPLPPDLDPLYELHAHLFILEKLVKRPASAWNSSGSYIGYHTQVARIISWPELSASSTKGWRSANMGRHSGDD